MCFFSKRAFKKNKNHNKLFFFFFLRGGAKVSPEARWRLRASGWGCRAGKLQRAWESPALNPLSSALRAARPADLAEPGKDGPDWRSHEAAAKLTRSGPAPRALDQSSKNAFPQLYYV